MLGRNERSFDIIIILPLKYIPTYTALLTTADRLRVIDVPIRNWQREVSNTVTPRFSHISIPQ